MSSDPSHGPPGDGRDAPVHGRTKRRVEDTRLVALVSGQINVLVSTLSSQTFESNKAELDQLSKEHGSDVDWIVLKTLIQLLDWGNLSIVTNEPYKCRLFVSQLSKVLMQPSFVTSINFAFRDLPLPVEEFLVVLARSLNVGFVPLLAIAIAITSSSDDAQAEYGKHQIAALIPRIANSPTGKIDDPISVAIVSLLLHYLVNMPPPTTIPSNDDYIYETRDSILHELAKTFPSIPPPLAVNPSRIEINESVCAIGRQLVEGGFKITSSHGSFKRFLKQFAAPLPSQAVAHMIIAIMNTHRLHDKNQTQLFLSVPLNIAQVEKGESLETWNLRVFAQGVNEMIPNLDWNVVADHLDQPGFVVSDTAALCLLLLLYSKVLRIPFPTKILYHRWRNYRGQWSLIEMAITYAPNNLFQFEPSPKLKALTSKLSINLVPAAIRFVNNFYSLPLLNILLDLASIKELQAPVYAFFMQRPVTYAPAVLLMGLGLTDKVHAQSVLRLSVISVLLTPAHATPNTLFALKILWEHDPAFVVKALVHLYNSDPAQLPRIHAIVDDMCVLQSVLDTQALSIFALDLACYAYVNVRTQPQFDMSTWLRKMMERHGDKLAAITLQFVKERLLLPASGNGGSGGSGSGGSDGSNVVMRPVSLSPEAVLTCLNVMRTNTDKMNAEHQEDLRRLISAVESSNFPAEIEKEADTTFRRIYSGQISVGEIVNLLKRYQESKSKETGEGEGSSTSTGEQREYLVYQCMIRNLLDEYRFYNKYPEKELHITALLFGSLIQHHLVQGSNLGVALRYVLDSLKQPVGSKLFNFGRVAIELFTSRLGEWPQYCIHLKQIPNIAQSFPQLFAVIDSTLASIATSVGSASGADTDKEGGDVSWREESEGVSSGGDGMAEDGRASTGEDTTVATSGSNNAVAAGDAEGETVSSNTASLGSVVFSEDEIKSPPEDLEDKIHFIFNNVASSNITSKAPELKKLIAGKLDVYNWLAFYIVVKRAALHENFQPLYLELLERLDIAELEKKVLDFSCRAADTLLYSEKIISDSSERLVLKYLANWLGLLTIARDKPLRHTDLPLKTILVESYETGRMIIVMPFVCKLLVTGAKSKWFKPPNPWIMAFVKLLVEIYNQPNLKLPLKFEVEIFLPAINVKIDDVVASDVLKGRKVYSGPRPITDFDFIAEEPRVKFNLQYVNINPSLTFINQQAQLKKAVYLAVAKAIQDVTTHVLERAVMIASLTTRELVLKDFAMEPDESKMLRAAYCMAQALTGSMAAVTSKDSLRVTMMNNLRVALGSQPGKPVPSHIEHAVHTLVQDNLELAVAVIQKAAAVASTTPTDEQLSSAVTDRKQHRERGGGRGIPYYDINFVGNSAYAFASTLPETLRPHMGGVTPQQMKVYDEFVAVTQHVGVGVGAGGSSVEEGGSVVGAGEKGKHDFGAGRLGRGGVVTSASTHATAVGVASSGSVSAGSYHPHAIAPESGGAEVPFASAGGPGNELLPISQATSLIDQYVAELVNAVAHLQHTTLSLASLPADHLVVRMLSRCGELIASSKNRQEVAYYAAQSGFGKLFDDHSNLLREVFLTFIDGIVSVDPRVRGKLTEFLSYSEPARKFHREIVPSLLHYGLLDVASYDTNLAQDILVNREAVDFAIFLVQTVVGKSSVITNNELGNTLEALGRLACSDLKIQHLLESVFRISLSRRRQQWENMENIATKNTPALSVAEQSVIAQLYSEWLTLCPTLTPTSEIAAQYLTKLHTEGYFKISGSGDVVKHTALRESLLMSCFFKMALKQYSGKEEAGKGKSESGDEEGKESEVSDVQADLSKDTAHSDGAKSDTGAGTDSTQADERNFGLRALAKLAVFITNSVSDKMTVWHRIVRTWACELDHTYKKNPTQFDQRPYVVLLSALITEVHGNVVREDTLRLPLYLTLRDFLSYFNPTHYPTFAFGWLELTCHRHLLPKLLQVRAYWPGVEELLYNWMLFMEPLLCECDMKGAAKRLYEGTLRLLLVLLHDFPEFLSDYHFSLCDHIPPACIQLRNLILSAFPLSMKLPDPFTPHLKVDLLPEIKEPPRIRSTFISVLSDAQLHNTLDLYLKSSEPSSFLPDLLHRLTLPPATDHMDKDDQSETDNNNKHNKNPETTLSGGKNSISNTNNMKPRYNMQLLNAVVLFIGVRALSDSASQLGEFSPQAPMEIIRYLAQNMNTEGRYLLCNAIANQLRYPNNHTHYFSCVILFLFAEAQQEIIQEQITRVLVERLIVHRPHPWGLLITFIELIKNPRYSFWGRAFTRCAPEIERLFYQVGTSIAQHQSEA